MQRAVLGVVASFAAMGLVSARAGVRVAKGKTPLDIIQEKADAIESAGEKAVVGVGSARTVGLALDLARTRAHTKLARTMGARVDALKKSFAAEVGAAGAAAFDPFFVAVREGVAQQTLQNSVPIDLKYKTDGGLTTACALMVANPKVIADAIADHGSSARHLYTRLRASEAFAQLHGEIRKFEEFAAEPLDDRGGLSPEGGYVASSDTPGARIRFDSFPRGGLRYRWQGETVNGFAHGQGIVRIFDSEGKELGA